MAAFFDLRRVTRHLNRLRSALRSVVVDCEWTETTIIRSHKQSAEMIDAFAAVGFPRRHFFPHAVHFLPKIAPDGLKFSTWMCNSQDVHRLWQAALFVLDPLRAEFPDDLYADTELNWHLQHFGRIGHIATACLRIAGDDLYVLNMHSDLVQRAARRPEFRTRIDARFNGWPRLMIHALAAHALEHGLKSLYLPTSTLAMEHTDKNRRVRPQLFERVYDRAAQHHFVVQRQGRWWRIDLSRQRDRIIPFARHEERLAHGPTICITHDLNRSPRQPALAPALSAMLAAERKLGVRATYNVPGYVLNDVRQEIGSGGHCIGFRSFDHDRTHNQLNACREVDYRIKGYRPPRSRVTGALKARLPWYDIEWLASSPRSLGVNAPALVNRIARIPVLFEDRHSVRKNFETWSGKVLQNLTQRKFVALNLSDRYAAQWLPHYERWLGDMKKVGRLRTLDEIASDMYLSAGI